jgi:hypothetical protein
VPISASITICGALVASFQQGQKAEVQDLRSSPAGSHELDFDVTIGGGQERLVLESCSVRSSTHRLWVEARDGLQSVAVAPPETYRGHLPGDSDSRAAALFRNGRLTAMVETDETWLIEPIRAAGPSSEHTARLFDDFSDLAGGTCGAHGSLDFSGAPGYLGGSGTPALGESGLPELEIALDSDFEYLQVLGSDITQTSEGMERLLMFTSMIYESEAGLQYKARETVVRTDPSADGYSYGEIADCKGGLYGFGPCFALVWGVPSAMHHDVLHFFSGRDILPPTSAGSVVGHALFNAPCALATPADYRRWGISERVISFNSSITLMAHEIGHNMGLFHICQGVHIMTPLLNQSVEFRASHVAQLGNKIAQLQNSGRIDTTGKPTAAPLLTSVSPASTPPYAGQPMHLFGEGLSSVFHLKTFGVTLSPGQIDYISDNGLAFFLPDPFASGLLGANSVTASNAGGSGSTTFDLVEVPKIEITAPPFFTLQFYSGFPPGADDTVAYGYGLSDTVIDFGTWSILADWNLMTVVFMNGLGMSGPIQENFDSSLLGLTILVQAIGTDGTNRSSTDPLGVILQSSAPEPWGGCPRRPAKSARSGVWRRSQRAREALWLPQLRSEIGSSALDVTARSARGT